MKKKFIRVMFFGTLALTTLSYVGCKDYDDDINRLEQKIAENASAIEKINKLIESGSVITKVENITGGVKVTLSNNESFTITNGTDGKDGAAGAAGKDGAQWTIGADGFWYKNDVKTEFKAKGDKGDTGAEGPQGPQGGSGTGTPGKDGDTYIPGEDGFWYKNEVKPENKTDKTWIVPGVVTVADMGDFYIFSNMKGADGKATSAKVYKYSATFVSSLVHVSSNINADLGDVVFLPVIGYDADSKNTAVYEYNKDEQPLYRTLVNGWAEYEYKVNPASVNPIHYSFIGFIEQTATTTATTRATEIGLPVSEVMLSTDRSKFIVRASAGDNAGNVNAFKMFKSDAAYDNPDGKPVAESSKYGEAGKVNLLAAMVKNTNAQLKSDVEINVVSDFVATKRMVIEQKETAIGLAVGSNKFANSTIVAPNLSLLSDMYKKNESSVNDYLKKLPVALKLMYTESLDLNTVLTGLATKFHTNTGFNSKAGQYLLTDLGFEHVTFEYVAESYKEAEVDQTMRYLKIEGSEISVINKQPAAINRNAVLKVKMLVDGKWVMSKLMKIEFVEKDQLTDDFTNEDLKPQTLACTALYGGGAKLGAATAYSGATVVDGLKIDFDQYFNALKVSKDKFVEYYGGNPTVTVTKDDAVFEGWSFDSEAAGKNLTIDYSNIEGTALTENNNVYFGLKNQLRAGTYVIKFTYSTTNTAPTYKSFTITTTLVVKDPVHTWTYNPSMWHGTEYMLGYGQPTSGDYGAPFLMKATIEDGFMDSWDGCGEWSFELVTNIPTSEATLTKTAQGKHELHILSNKWIGKKITIRAVEYIDTKSSTNRKINNIVSATNSSEFDIMFVSPVTYAEVSSAWYLVDKASTTVINEGAYLPLYRLFKLYDVKKGEENGMMFDGSKKSPWFERNTVKIGESLFKMHKVEVSYALSTKNNAIVLKHASILKNTGKEVGLLKWNNNEGVLVGDTDQPIIIDVTIKNSWMGSPSQTTTQTKEVTVYVKKADTKYTMPSTGFLGTLDAPEGLGSYSDLK